MLNIGRIWDFIAEKNIEPQDILELVEEVKRIDIIFFILNAPFKTAIASSQFL